MKTDEVTDSLLNSYGEKKSQEVRRESKWRRIDTLKEKGGGQG